MVSHGRFAPSSLCSLIASLPRSTPLALAAATPVPHAARGAGRRRAPSRRRPPLRGLAALSSHRGGPQQARPQRRGGRGRGRGWGRGGRRRSGGGDGGISDSRGRCERGALIQRHGGSQGGGRVPRQGNGRQASGGEAARLLGGEPRASTSLASPPVSWHLMRVFLHVTCISLAISLPHLRCRSRLGGTSARSSLALSRRSGCWRRVSHRKQASNPAAATRHWSLTAVADRCRSLGRALTARSILIRVTAATLFEELALWEECASAMTLIGEPAKAEAMVRSRRLSSSSSSLPRPHLLNRLTSPPSPPPRPPPPPAGALTAGRCTHARPVGAARRPHQG